MIYSVKLKMTGVGSGPEVGGEGCGEEEGCIVPQGAEWSCLPLGPGLEPSEKGGPTRTLQQEPSCTVRGHLEKTLTVQEPSPQDPHSKGEDWKSLGWKDMTAFQWRDNLPT